MPAQPKQDNHQAPFMRSSQEYNVQEKQFYSTTSRFPPKGGPAGGADFIVQQNQYYTSFNAPLNIYQMTTQPQISSRTQT